MSENITTYLAENPKMIGVLFAMFLLLSQVGNVTAVNAGISGP